MRRVLFFLLLLLVAVPVAAESVRLFDGTLSFDLPSEFRPMTEAEIVKMPPFLQLSQRAQITGYIDSDGFDVMIVVARTTNAMFASDKLTAIGEMMHQLASRRDGVTVRRHGLVSIGTAQWYAIDFSGQAADEPAENRLRIGIRTGYVVVFSVDAVTRVFPRREAELLRVLETLKLQ